MPDIAEIASGPLLARFAPTMGGRIVEFRHRDAGHIVIPIQSATFDPLAWPRGGAYPLFPYHNRLVGAAFKFQGTQYQVRAHPALSGDAMHGPTHRKAWNVVRHEPERLVMAIDYDADEDWPFSFRAEQDFTITQHGLQVGLRLANRDKKPMPGGLGWHPYFAASISQPARTDARSAFALDARDLPRSEAAEPRTGEQLPAREGYTIHLSDWTTAETSLDCGLTLRMRSGAPLHHLAVHRMANYLCLEPVSSAASALAHRDDIKIEMGLEFLQPGQALEGQVHVSVG
ncbi:aldose 1-epimerase [Oryzifoliimicrobium ureilyticus]|uniref:aldose epimerase family protein n=1 Tax=Oryzifoliimicrobium ureilyticus TaxID=3113724 RepID=UPI003076225B